MKRTFKILIPLLLILSVLISSLTCNAVSYKSISKSPTYRYGVDVSEWNGDLDWSVLRKSGVEFAYIRIGYYHPGGGTADYRFKQNVKNCVENGIDFGVYVYSYVYKHSDTVKCAKWIHKVLASMGNYTKDKDTIQVAYDIEDEVQKNAVDHGRASRSYMHNGVQKFCDKVESYGYVPVVYSFQSFFSDYLYLEKFQSKNIRIWYAVWPYVPKVKQKCIMYNDTYADVWQYSSTTTINGGVFDANVCYTDFYDYSKEDSKLKLKGIKESYPYKKGGVKPSFKLYSGNTLLKKGKDYKVFYFNNKATGRARMKIVRYKNGKFFETKTVIYYVQPVAVKKLKATPGRNSVALKWEGLKGAVGYQIFEYDTFDKTYNLIDTVKTTSYTDCFLDEANEYKFKVRAVAKIEGTTVYGNYSSITASTRYKKIDLKSVKSKKKSEATVNWTAKTSNTKGYWVEYSTDKTFKNKLKKQYKGIDNSSAILKKLKSGSKYYVRVRSYNFVNKKPFYSLYSDVKTVKIK